MSAVKTRNPAPDILVMEDEATVAKGLEMVLSEEGYRVALAATGHEAIDTFVRKEFDLLVADLRLPDMNGMRLVETIRREVREFK